jgi:tetratricopeptide (TPR) repeat protein
MAHTKLAQYTEAANAFSKSLEIDPENYRAQDALDEACVKESSESQQAKASRKIYLRRKRKTS